MPINYFQYSGFEHELHRCQGRDKSRPTTVVGVRFIEPSTILDAVPSYFACY